MTAAAPTGARGAGAVDANGMDAEARRILAVLSDEWPERGVVPEPEHTPIEFGCLRCPYRSRNLGEWAEHVESCEEKRNGH